MADKERIERAVFAAIDVMNDQLPKGSRIEKSQDSPLYGKDGNLESLDFVTFIMEIETKVQEEFGFDFVLTDEDLLTKETSPFTTVGRLIEHLETAIEGK